MAIAIAPFFIMCKYAKNGRCSVLDDVCPFMYFCEKRQTWRALTSMPTQCNVAKKRELPKGCYVVKEERKGFLYVDLGESTIKLPNPFDYTPEYVKLSKTKSGYKIKK